MAPYIQTVNVLATASGANEIVENPFATVAEAATHGQQRGAVIRVHSFLIQNQNSTNVQATWMDGSGTNIEGPVTIPTNWGNWTERTSPPAFLFETTRNSTNSSGFDLQLNLNSAINCQVFVEYSVSFAPGRVAG